MGKNHVFYIGILVGAIFLWLALRDAPTAELAYAFGSANLLWIAPFLLALFGFYWLKALRWRILLTPLIVTETRTVFPPVMVGYSANVVLPAQLGEIVRVIVGARALGLGYSETLATVVLERIFDFLTVLLVLGLALLLGAETSATMLHAGYLVTGLTVALTGGVLVFARWTERCIVFTRFFTRHLRTALERKLLDSLRRGAVGLQALNHSDLLLQTLLISVAQWACMLLCVWISLAALGITAPFAAALLVLALTVVGVSLPTSPGYVGTIQFAYTLALAQYEIASATALAASVFYHALAYFSVFFVGLYYLHRMGYTLGQVKAEAEAAHYSEPAATTQSTQNEQS
ncbi:MAG: flippase-like domain-containing protein [Gammaproteobacteria bacterium]|nr:flippase-like domain-containing protein [Gammaproteobacteria bacterium]